MTEASVDSLDAYMASLELPSGDQSMSMAHARAECSSSRPTVRHGLPVVVKNRRFKRLQQLLQDTSEDHFFSDAMMQQRSPALFHFYVGQYLGSDPTLVLSVDPTEHPLSSFLMDTYQRREMEARRVAEQQKWGQFSAADEKKEQSRLHYLFDNDTIQEEEKEEKEEEEEEEEDAARCTINERRRQLVGIMSTRFLNGEDGEYVVYAAIDADKTLDDLDEMQRDAENHYFADGRATIY